MADLHDLSALELATEISTGRISPVDVVDHYLARIERYSRDLGAFTTVTADAARSAAKKAEQEVRRGADLPPLHGVPIAIKDLTNTAGVRTTFGSAVFADYIPTFDDDVVGFLRDAGTISLGKTNAPEFGLPCYTENRVAPPARTPFDPTRLAGGSSGGAATSVAAGLLPFAHATDGGGSIRIPASVCGLVGIKTSRGRVSRGPLGTDPLGLSVTGPLARSTADAAALLDAMSVTSLTEPAPALPLPPGQTFLAAAYREPGKLRIGRTLDTPVPDVQIATEVQDAYDAASALLIELGHEVVDLELPAPAGLLDAFVKVWASFSLIAPLPPGAEQLLMPLTKYMMQRGAAMSSTEVVRAISAVQGAGRVFLWHMLPFDAVLTPTVSQTPRPVGYFTEGGDPATDFDRQMRFSPWTAQINMTGQPAINVPLHWTEDGLPIGVQFIGRPGDECTLISLSAQLEQAAGWRHHQPVQW